MLIAIIYMLITNLDIGSFTAVRLLLQWIHNDLLMMIDKKTNVLLLLLDLSAAFDTINHTLLLKKLQRSYGITDTALQWLKSYLSNRTFKVAVGKSCSSECTLEIGVPQGSILGPLLFILYTKDLEKVISKYGFSVHLYADDTQIYLSFDVHSKSPDLNSIKMCFQDIKQWMMNNFLKSRTYLIRINFCCMKSEDMNFCDTYS